MRLMSESSFISVYNQTLPVRVAFPNVRVPFPNVQEPFPNVKVPFPNVQEPFCLGL